MPKGIYPKNGNWNKFHSDGTIRCAKCHLYKQPADFPLRGKSRKGYQRYYPYCKACHVLYQKEQNLKMSRMHNITWDEYNAILAWQDGRCAICHDIPFTRLAVDHDHLAGLVRGLLCQRCNRGLGYYKDNQEILRRSADYLVNPPAQFVIGKRLVRLEYKRGGHGTRKPKWQTIHERDKRNPLVKKVLNDANRKDS